MKYRIVRFTFSFEILANTNLMLFWAFRYFEWLKGAVSCAPCTDNSDRTECVNQTAYSTASPASSVTESGSGHSKGIDKIQTSTPGWSPPHGVYQHLGLV